MNQKQVWALRAAGFLIVTVIYFVWTGFKGGEDQAPKKAVDQSAVSSQSSRSESSVGQSQSPE